MESILRESLLKAGATVVGFASVEDSVEGEIRHLSRALSIGIRGKLRGDVLLELKGLQKRAALFLKRRGYRYLCIPPDSDRIRDTFISRLYPLLNHKMAATCAGIGWIGRNGLLISRKYGPRLALATVLTDAPLRPDSPVMRSRCGQCSLCVQHCPAGAITGESWSRSDPFPDLIHTDRCRKYKRRTRSVSGRPNCGLCINICPYGREKWRKLDECETQSNLSAVGEPG